MTAGAKQVRRGDLRPLFTGSIHTGLRWSEQRPLEWRDVDVLTGLLMVWQWKSGHSRQIPMNSVVRSGPLDLAGVRREPDNPEEPVLVSTVRYKLDIAPMGTRSEDVLKLRPVT